MSYFSNLLEKYS